MTTLEAQHEVITNLILENKKLAQERDELLIELEEYRSIAENIGAVKAVSEKEKAIRERDEVRETLMAIEDRCVDCEDACDDIQKIREIARSALEK